MADIIKIKTPFEQAEKAGKEVLRKATEDHKRRIEYSNKESYQAAKEGATYLYNLNKGKVMVTLGFSDNYERIFGHK